MTNLEDFLTLEQEQAIVQVIRTVERNTSGEIRVHLEKDTSTDTLQRAVEVFHILEMNETEQRNGVLFYVAVIGKKFAIYGDEGINAVVPQNFWQEIKAIMQEYFVQGNFSQGLIEGILKAGEELKRYFPYLQTDRNELSDEISKGTI